MTDTKYTFFAAYFLLSSAVTGYGKIAVIQNPPNAKIHYYFLSLKGAYEHESRQFVRAKETYASLAMLTPHDLSLERARTYTSFQAGCYQEVIEHYEKGNIKEIELLFLVAQSYLFQAQFEKALALFQSLAIQDAEDNRFTYFIVTSLIHLGRKEEALQKIEEGLKNTLYKNKHNLLFLKAKMLFASSALDEAAEVIAEALTLNPSFGKGLYLQGAIYEQQNDNEKARASYEAALALSPHDEAIRRRISGLEHINPYQVIIRDIAKKEFARAEKAITLLLSKDMKDAQAQELAIACFVAQEKFEALKAELTTWLCHYPTDRTLMKRLLALRKKKMPIRMLSSVFQEAAMHQNTWQLCFALGDLLHEQRNYEQARDWYNTALNECTEKPDAFTQSQLHYQIAGAFYSEGALPECRMALTNALATNAPCPEAANLLSLIKKTT